MQPNRIIAIFHPQQWINDYAVQSGPDTPFDITDQILAMDRMTALAIYDDDYESDNLWLEHPDIELSDHNDPFWVECENSIADYFESLDVEHENRSSAAPGAKP